MAANDSGKHNVVVMQEANDSYDSHSSSELQRKVAKLVGPIDASMEVGLETLDRDHNLSRSPANSCSSPNGQSWFDPNLGQHPATAAC